MLSNIALSLFSWLGYNDQPSFYPIQNWEMVWSDEFKGKANTTLDSTKWTFEIGTGDDGWGNHEWQYYTQRPENAALDGKGNLIITARKENYLGSNYTSARIKTQGLFTQTYGRVEARIKTPYGSGIWPAFWMLGDDITTVGWPACGEIDIMELKGNQPNMVYGSLHAPDYFGGNAISKIYSLPKNTFNTDFHLFAVEWYPDRIDFYIDHFLYHQVKRAETKGKWVYDHPFFILLNLAIGGDFVGSPNEKTVFPQKMYIDYVRVYQKRIKEK